MHINGKPALSGALVLMAGESGAIDVQGGLLAVHFANDAGTLRVALNPSTGGVTIFNSDDSPLGAYFNPQVELAGTRHTFRLIVYTYGRPVVSRAIHYSATSEAI